MNIPEGLFVEVCRVKPFPNRFCELWTDEMNRTIETFCSDTLSVLSYRAVDLVPALDELINTTKDGVELVRQRSFLVTIEVRSYHITKRSFWFTYSISLYKSG